MHKALRRALVSLGAVPAATLVTVMLAIPAGAATTGANVYSPTQAGYTGTGNTFRFIKADFPLPDPTQFASEVKRIEFTVEFWNSSKVSILGVWASTSSTSATPWHIQASVYSDSTKTLICSTSGSKKCAGVPSAWGSETFPVGHVMELSSYFSSGQGTVRFHANDLQNTSKQVYYLYKAGTKLQTQVRISASYGCGPWTACGGGKVSYNPPVSQVHVEQVDDCEVTTTAGPRTGFLGAFTHHSLTMTTTGTSAGTVESDPSPLYKGMADNPGGQFDVYLEP